MSARTQGQTTPSAFRILWWMVSRIAAAICVSLATGWVGASGGADQSVEPERPGRRVLIPDRQLDVFPKPPWPAGVRTPLAEAAGRFGERKIQVAGTEVDAALLSQMAQADIHEPMTRVMREALSGPVDPDDFIFFLDDVLREDRPELRGAPIWITPNRARKAGIFLHPDDVFEGKPRRYGDHGPLATFRPRLQSELPPANDGDPLGPNWTMRFRNPTSEAERLAALGAIPGAASLEVRVRSLVEQLRAQGARVELTSTLRSPERGYLMWGAFLLGQADGRKAVSESLERLAAANADWELDVPIQWRHPAGWKATRDSAREMADTYAVVFATESGARFSDHYTGRAVDLVAVALPRSLELIGSDGEIGRFDLSDPDQSRDLNLSPALIEWVEQHFGLKKLHADYPHWLDGR